MQPGCAAQKLAMKIYQNSLAFSKEVSLEVGAGHLASKRLVECGR